MINPYEDLWAPSGIGDFFLQFLAVVARRGRRAGYAYVTGVFSSRKVVLPCIATTDPGLVNVARAFAYYVLPMCTSIKTLRVRLENLLLVGSRY